jgi:hypothetical protein
VEFSASDFEHLLGAFFADVELYGQRRIQTLRHRTLQRLDVFGLRRRLTFLRPAAKLLGTRPTAELSSVDLAIEKHDVDSASELVAVCRRPRRA